MAKVVYRFLSDEDFGHYLSQLEDAGLSGNITKWMVEGYNHILIGDDLPVPTPELFNNNHAYTFYDEADMVDVLNNVSLPSLWQIRNKGGQFVFAGLGGGDVISSEAQAVLDSMPNALTTTERNALIEFVNGQSSSIGNGNWSLIDSFSHFGLLDPINSLWDWKRESAMTNGGSTHTAGVGRSFAGAEWIDTNYNPSTDAINYVLNSGSMGGFVVDIIPQEVTTQAIFGGGTRVAIYDDEVSNRRFAFSQTSSGLIQNGFRLSNNSLFTIQRIGATEYNIYENGVISGPTGTQVSVSLSTRNTYVGAELRTTAEGFFNGTISSYYAGGVIDQASYYSDLVDLNNALAAAAP